MNDLHSNINAVGLNAKGPVRFGVTGSVVADLRGFSAAEVMVGVEGTGASFSAANLVRVALFHGDTPTAATAACSANDLIGVATAPDGVILTLNTSTAAAPQVLKVGYKGGRRYLRVRHTASGTASGTVTGFTQTRLNYTVIRGRAGQRPVA